ncbi:MAG: hypothetical protein JXB29_05395 [Sedimentisphaerales bacterium]|nr:hypothetical protein [Sedimentisphaerales bacterium]
MGDIHRRLKAIEKKLNVGQQVENHIIEICYVSSDGKGGRVERCPKRPIEQNPQYIEQTTNKQPTDYSDIS